MGANDEWIAAGSEWWVGGGGWAFGELMLRQLYMFYIDGWMFVLRRENVGWCRTRGCNLTKLETCLDSMMLAPNGPCLPVFPRCKQVWRQITNGRMACLGTLVLWRNFHILSFENGQDVGDILHDSRKQIRRHSLNTQIRALIREKLEIFDSRRAVSKMSSLALIHVFFSNYNDQIVGHIRQSCEKITNFLSQSVSYLTTHLSHNKFNWNYDYVSKNKIKNSAVAHGHRLLSNDLHKLIPHVSTALSDSWSSVPMLSWSALTTED
jgi:hypothetical protein